ncbi:MAG TPA: methylated-DNA--[protein]-cysteine S-methyltransferase [Bacteroidales bacterium]|jgi:AraC family transcriptional regulator of adaptative response/methylated-DNA-[protein]-cysteine methyltransferase|nr:methylated-DNA--[protein]-cysteine S-methyltransferase [Bacteroidales bacterium]
MEFKEKNNFERIALAIEYISSHFREQPDLDDVASKVNLSPFHFQRLFTEWAGVSPKKFVQYMTISYAKSILREDSLLNVSYDTGLSGSGRLHDLFITIEGMTPGEYKNGGENLLIRYSYEESPFGKILIASTSKGICNLAFENDEDKAMQELHNLFPNAGFIHQSDMLHQVALSFIDSYKSGNRIALHLKGTPFQLKVWEALLKIPSGRLTTYGAIARNINHPTASRAVGSAIGDNPVALLIPCHRVIQQCGVFGHYHWGASRKKAIIAWEAAKTN